MKYSLVKKMSVLLIAVVVLSPLFFPPKIARASRAGDLVTSCLKAAVAGGAVDYLSTALQTLLATLSGAQEATSVPTSNAVVEKATSASAIFEKYTKGFKDCLMYGAGQILLDDLNKDVLYWVQTGFDGNPLFAINLNQIYLDNSGLVADTMSSQFGKIPVTEFVPGYKQRVGNQLSLSTRQDASKKFEQSITPTLPEGVVPQDFYNDFNAGGWDAYMSSLYDNNNGFGVELLTNQELATRQQEAYNIQQQKLLQASGFIDVPDTSKCNYPPEVKDRIDSADPEVQYAPAQLAAAQKMYCQIETPGKVAESQTTETVKSDKERYGFIDTLSKLANEYFMEKIRQKISNGVFNIDFSNY